MASPPRNAGRLSATQGQLWVLARARLRPLSRQVTGRLAHTACRMVAITRGERHAPGGHARATSCGTHLGFTRAFITFSADLPALHRPDSPTGRPGTGVGDARPAMATRPGADRRPGGRPAASGLHHKANINP